MVRLHFQGGVAVVTSETRVLLKWLAVIDLSLRMIVHLPAISDEGAWLFHTETSHGSYVAHIGFGITLSLLVRFALLSLPLANPFVSYRG